MEVREGLFGLTIHQEEPVSKPRDWGKSERRVPFPAAVTWNPDSSRCPVFRPPVPALAACGSPAETGVWQ